MKQLQYNYDNFKKVHDKCEEMEELIISLTAQLAIAESKVKACAHSKKEKKNVNK